MEFSRQTTSGSSITQTDSGWRLEIPPGTSTQYRLAQLDDYASLKRSDFIHQAPTVFSMRARTSSNSIPGTWGFGFWNDPFSTIIGLGGMTRPLPALPNTAWFFYGSQDNYLSFRNDKSANGFLAATFSSPQIPTFLLASTIFASPLLFFKSSAKWIRQQMSRRILEDSALLEIDVTEWHRYKMQWENNLVSFEIDENSVFVTRVAPNSPLGLVIWIDNQYAAFKPSGKINTGSLENPVPAWMEIENLIIV
jgi:hypothetical protein